MYVKVILRDVRVTIVAVQKQRLLHNQSECIYCLWYRASNAQGPYCHLWSAPFYNIFPHYVINGAIFEKEKLLNTKCVFWFFLQFLSETFLIIFPTLSHKRHDFRKKSLLNTKCVFWFSLQLFSDTFPILKQSSETLSQMCAGIQEKYPLFLSDFNKLLISSTDFSKYPQISNFMRIVLVRAELFHADGGTDRREEVS